MRFFARYFAGFSILLVAGCAATRPAGLSENAARSTEPSPAAASTPTKEKAAPHPSPAPLSLGEDPVIRVLLADSTPEIVVVFHSPGIIGALDNDEALSAPADSVTTLTVSEGRVMARCGMGSDRGKPVVGNFESTALLLESLSPGGAMTIRTAPGCPDCKPAIAGRSYEGRIEVFPAENGSLALICALPVEEYLRGVVPYEIGPDSPPEAMRAQAVAARSEAFVALATRKYAGRRYDICSTVACQVFGGASRRSPGSDEAVLRTRGEALWFEGRPISAFYSSNCGGHSEDIRVVWSDRADEKAYWDATGFDGDPGAAPNLDLTRENDLRAWLKLNPSAYCNPDTSTIPAWTHKNFRWTREATAEQMTEWVARKKDIGRVIAIRPLRRGVSGRIVEIEFIGEKGTCRAGAELEIRRMFKPALKSGAFVVDAEGPADRPDRFVIHGAGSGHGVGMCQTGAIGMANGGKTYKEILNHYYPRAELTKWY